MREFSSVSFENPPESKLFTRSQSVTVFVNSPPSNPSSAERAAATSSSTRQAGRRSAQGLPARSQGSVTSSHRHIVTPPPRAFPFFFSRTTEAAIKAKLRFNTSGSIHRRCPLSSRRTRRERGGVAADAFVYGPRDEVKLKPTAGLYIIPPQSLNKAEGPPRDEKKNKKNKNGPSRRATTSSGAHPAVPSLPPADVIHAQFPASRQRL